MAFKINTRVYPSYYPQVTPSKPTNLSSVETPVKNTIKTGKTTTTPQIKFPSPKFIE